MVLRDADSLLQAVGNLHTAAGDASRWPVAFDSVSDLMGASAMLLGKVPHRAGQFEFVGHRMDPAIVQRINGPLATREANPVFCAIPRTPVLHPVIISSVLDSSELLRSTVYGEAMEPAEIRYAIAAVLDSDAEHALAVTFGRAPSHDDFDSDDVRILNILAPHLTSAIRLHHELSAARLAGSMLDSFDRGIVLLDIRGQISFANEEAERILHEGDGLRRGQSGVVTARPEETARLKNLIAGCGGVGTANGKADIMAVSRPSLRPSYSVVVAPVGPGTNVVPDLVMDACIALFIRDPERRSQPPTEWLCQLYGLTHTEAAIALDLHQGFSLAESAEQRTISMNTVKTHLKVIFQKMDITRQSALIREISLAMGDLRMANALGNEGARHQR